jgi:S1-C subfamily serine protease
MSRFWRHFVSNGSAGLVEGRLGIFGRRAGSLGLKICLVHKGSTAAAAGIQRGDVLLSLDDVAVTSLRGLERQLLDLPVGMPFAIVLQRGEQRIERWLILNAQALGIRH